MERVGLVGDKTILNVANYAHKILCDNTDKIAALIRNIMQSKAARGELIWIVFLKTALDVMCMDLNKILVSANLKMKSGKSIIRSVGDTMIIMDHLSKIDGCIIVNDEIEAYKNSKVVHRAGEYEIKKKTIREWYQKSCEVAETCYSSLENVIRSGKRKVFFKRLRKNNGEISMGNFLNNKSIMSELDKGLSTKLSFGVVSTKYYEVVFKETIGPITYQTSCDRLKTMVDGLKVI